MSSANEALSPPSTESKLRPYDKAGRIVAYVGWLSFGMLLLASQLEIWGLLSMRTPPANLAMRLCVLVLLASLVCRLLIKLISLWVRWR